jgi:hypothetical protein
MSEGRKMKFRKMLEMKEELTANVLTRPNAGKDGSHDDIMVHPCNWKCYHGIQHKSGLAL